MTDGNPTDQDAPAAPPNIDSQAAAPALDPPAAGNESEATKPDEIRDPAAYWKAQARKERTRKRQARNPTRRPSKQFAGLQEAQQQTLLEAVKAAKAEAAEQHEALTKALTEATAKADAERVQALRVKAIANAKLPDDFVNFLKGESEEDIAKEIETLAKHIGQQQPLASIRTTNAAASQTSDGAPSWLTQTSTFGKGGVSLKE